MLRGEEAHRVRSADVQDRERVEREFTFHAPRDAVDVEKHEAVNAQMKETARLLVEVVPAGRERALMLTKLQEARMWANAGLAVARAKEESDE